MSIIDECIKFRENDVKYFLDNIKNINMNADLKIDLIRRINKIYFIIGNKNYKEYVKDYYSFMILFQNILKDADKKYQPTKFKPIEELSNDDISKEQLEKLTIF